MKKLAVISGDGVKNYYREKFGFKNGEYYLIKIYKLIKKNAKKILYNIFPKKPQKPWITKKLMTNDEIMIRKKA